MPSLKIRISLGITDMKPPKTTGMLGFNNGDQRLTVRHSIAHIRYCVYLIIIVPILSPLLYLLFVLNYSGLYGCWNHNFRFICLCLFLNPIFHAQTPSFFHVFSQAFPRFLHVGNPLRSISAAGPGDAKWPPPRCCEPWPWCHPPAEVTNVWNHICYRCIYIYPMDPNTVWAGT